MDEPRTVENALIDALCSAGTFNPDVQVAPACILWPDKDRQWRPVVPSLQTRLPELLVLGDYAPNKRTGPAIWLRCLLARALDESMLPEDKTPILYLPGVGRSDLRAVDSCPDDLKPLAELQYRGTLWSQVNGKDWTVLAFLKSDQGGLGLDVAADQETRRCMVLALHKLLDEEVHLLAGKRLDRDYFHTLLTGGDPVRDLLQWLNDPDGFRSARGDNDWEAFVQLCRSQLAFDPSRDGPLSAAASLAAMEGPWRLVWERFSEALGRYPHIPQQIRRCTPPEFDLFADTEAAGGWPQWNEAAEQRLAADLVAAAGLAPHEAREQVLKLEQRHAERRRLVWASLGEAQLARALAPLAELADLTARTLAAGDPADMAKAYQEWGWRADDAVLRALDCVTSSREREAVTLVVRALYMPWAEEAARHLQQHWNPETDGIRLASRSRGPSQDDTGPECILFVDGLRFDCAQRLQAMLEQSDLEVEGRSTWAALPSVTGTGKYAVAPVVEQERIGEAPEASDFTPITPHLFKRLLAQAGWQVLDKHAVSDLHHGADTSFNTWCEFGDLDHEGHDRGWKLAQRVDTLLSEVHERILALLDAGWQSVRVVTDHGWLLVPGGLPKTELAAGLADTKWGRCAVLKSGARASVPLFPWYWDPARYFALADGIGCFRKNVDYAHGGLSLQECLTPELAVKRSSARISSSVFEIVEIVWRGLRCKVAVDDEAAGAFEGLTLDVRRHPGDPESSVALAPKPFKSNGVATAVVEDEDQEGAAATVVVVNAEGEVIAQKRTRIGGED